MRLAKSWGKPALIAIVLGWGLCAHAQIGGSGNQGGGLAQTLSQHGPNAAQIIAAHDQDAPENAAARAERAKRRRLDAYKHIQRDTLALQQAVAQLSSELNAPAGNRPTQARAQVAVKDAEKIQKLAGDINKRIAQ
jgi:predicted dinucleotide-binding enzyme